MQSLRAGSPQGADESGANTARHGKSIITESFATGSRTVADFVKLAEKIRCCGAGIPAFYTITGKNTLYAERKLPKKFDSSGNGKVMS